MHGFRVSLGLDLPSVQCILPTPVSLELRPGVYRQRVEVKLRPLIQHLAYHPAESSKGDGVQRREAWRVEH